MTTLEVQEVSKNFDSATKLRNPSISVNEITHVDLPTKLQALRPQLSSEATIVIPSDAAFSENAVRWSEYAAPSPGAVVNVASEADIANTVKWATSNGVKFIARAGGNGFTSSLKILSKEGIVINLRALNNISVDLLNGEAKIGAGATINEVLDATYAAKAHTVTGICGEVGVVPATLGGGLGLLNSLYGLGVDNMLSARLIRPSGEVINVSSTENSDLWWGLRGAGHNFGIVSELTVKAYPQVNDGLHWTGMLMFPGAKPVVESVVKTLADLHLGEGMGVTAIFARPPPAGWQPMVILSLWYAGSDEDARSAFSKFFELGPVMNMCGPTPYNKIIAANDDACVKGGRKPCYSVGLEQLNVEKMTKMWTLWESFTAEHDDARESVILVECYGWEKVLKVAVEETAYPHRHCRQYLVASLKYSDPSLDEAAEKFGDTFRNILHGEKKSVYVNFANGDEDPEVVYGGRERLARLQALKKKWDPKSVFSCYNPLI